MMSKPIVSRLVRPCSKEGLDFFLSMTTSVVFGIATLYLLSFPIAFKKDGTKICKFHRPVVHLLETPARKPLACYLKMWGIEPEHVECAGYGVEPVK
jgi:hypothetical protein